VAEWAGAAEVGRGRGSGAHRWLAVEWAGAVAPRGWQQVSEVRVAAEASRGSQAAGRGSRAGGCGAGSSWQRCGQAPRVGRAGAAAEAGSGWQAVGRGWQAGSGQG
jgi:hypothetical protein